MGGAADESGAADARMSQASERATGKAEQQAMAELAALSPDDFEEAPEDLIQVLKDRLAAQRAIRRTDPA